MRFGLFACGEEGVEAIRYFIEAVADQSNLVARAEVDAFAQITSGKSARGAGQRLDIADNGIIGSSSNVL